MAWGFVALAMAAAAAVGEAACAYMYGIDLTTDSTIAIVEYNPETSEAPRTVLSTSIPSSDNCLAIAFDPIR